MCNYIIANYHLSKQFGKTESTLSVLLSARVPAGAHMVEPFAAAAIARPSFLKLPRNAMARPSRRPFPADFFFSPPPRPSKGKERAVEPHSIECSQCRFAVSTSACVTRHSPWCPIRNRLFMTNQVIPRRSQPLPQPPQRGARRHSSSAPRVLSSQTRLPHLPQTVRLPHEPDASADRLRSLLIARTPFDPEHAWQRYTECPTDSTLTPNEKVQFVQRVVDAFDLRHDAPPNLPLLHTWGTRLEPVLRDLKSSLPVDALQTFSLACLTALVHTWLGDVTEALQLARQVRDTAPSYANRATLLLVYRNILVLLRYQHGASHALDLLVREWKFLDPLSQTGIVPLPHAVSFRNAMHSSLADVPDGASLLQSRSKDDEHDRSYMANLLMEAYCAKGLLHKAHALVLEMCRQQLPVDFSLLIKLTRRLARQKSFVLAHEIFKVVDPSTKPQLYYSTGLHLYARCGDVDRAEQFFRKHKDNDWAIPIARCMLMHAYAVAGSVDTVVELFHKFFPVNSAGNFIGERPELIHYSTVILAHAEVADSDGINLWLKKMLEVGCHPDGHVYSIILQSFAGHGDLDAVVATLDQMRAAEVKPDRVHYTSIVTLLARRKDAVAAEAIYLRALREGIVPDRIMISSLMNAHVEAGSWEGVIRVFDYLRQSLHFRHDLPIEAYNVLFKAYVLIGTPFRVVLNLFRKLTRVGVRPDRYTYALVIQSACDAGKMNVAEALFAEMESKATCWEPSYHLDACVLTIIMAGHVRQRSIGRARACYENMQRRGIKPSSVTYRQVIQTYANDQTEGSLRIAESFLREIMDADADDPTWAGSESRSSALGNIYSPLMLAYARQEKPEEVARLFNRMLEAGGEPSLQSLTIILDVHRRTNNIDGVRQLWPQIWALALRLSSANELIKGDSIPSAPVTKRRPNLLCMPLSIYIDALSAAGEHHAVLDAWTRTKKEGFSFDAHNWNHLAVVLVRAGELDRAFEVLERVLIPYSRKKFVTRDEFPKSPFVFEVMSPDADVPASDAPMQREVRRAGVVEAATKTAGSMLAASEESTDFVHPLHILHQVIPGLSMWRPHAVTLQVLSRVLGHLQRGRLVQPVRAPHAPPATSQHHADLQSQAEIANATLQRIYRNYPEAIRALLLYERGRARHGTLRQSPKRQIKVGEQVADTLADGDTIGLHES